MENKNLKIIIFDVGDAFCALVRSPNGYGLMIDCGFSSDKTNPIDVINNYRGWIKMREYTTQNSRKFPLALLHITHPDDDHVRNAKTIKEKLTPYLLRSERYENFDDANSINKDYVELNKQYRGISSEIIDWGFDEYKEFWIPIEDVKSEPELKGKVRNNSSILCYIKFAGVRILFTGDLETSGWEWLKNHDSSFVKTMKEGLDILIAPHHGHKSAFPNVLFELTGNVDVVILPKDSEANKEKSDVSTQYSAHSNRVKYMNLNDKKSYCGRTLSSRSNGTIYIDVDYLGSINFYCEKASSNHNRVD